MRFTNVNPGEHPEFIIVGLGNPGKKYDDTRHNVGFKVVDYIDAESSQGRGCKRMLHSSLCDKCTIDGHIVYIVKPQTFMNNSGMAVKDVMSYYRLRNDNLIVIHDDTSLPVGSFMIKNGGSPNGHNGLKSIIQHLKSDSFTRIRVGIGEVPQGWEKSNYVLSKITDPEMRKITKNFDLIKECISFIIDYGTEKAIAKYNSK